jgi:hypothetical protein
MSRYNIISNTDSISNAKPNAKNPSTQAYIQQTKKNPENAQTRNKILPHAKFDRKNRHNRRKLY